VSNDAKNSRAKDYLEHMAEALSRIERYLAGVDHSGFLADERTQDAVIRNIEVIGEAAGKLLRECPDFCQKHSEIPWEVVYGMRNRLIHGYSEINLEIVWNTAPRSIPQLKTQITSILTSL